jgi:hypothetical protein
MEDLKEIIGRLKLEFSKIGARIKLIPFTPTSKLFRSNLVTACVAHDKDGEFFEILVSKDIIRELRVVRVNLESKHLILVADHQTHYLCGHFDGSLYINNLSTQHRKLTKNNNFSISSENNSEDLPDYPGKPGLNFTFIRHLFSRMQTVGFYRYYN